ncbi:MAG TPA: peptide chain release factor N(5)-glutamine methyltransferase [Bacteroidota bacterium]
MRSRSAKAWRVRALMKQAIDYLQKRGIPEPRLNVELLLAHALQCRRIELYTNVERLLTKQELTLFRSLFERRLAFEPVQYIIGSTNFMGLQFMVDRRVLIPRPETETLVEQVMMRCNALQEKNVISLLEIGAGSGNIAVSIAKFVRNAVVTSIDSSAQALEVARQNALAHGVEEKVFFQHMDVYEPVDQLVRRRFEFLVSNPPYVSINEWEVLRPEVRDYEPRDATSDGADGYEFFRRLIELAPYVLQEGGMALFEVGDNMAFTVLSMMQEAGFYDLVAARDLQGMERVVIGLCHARVQNPVPVN